MSYGSVVQSVQLAHNYRDPESVKPKSNIIYNFGRREEMDLDGLRRLVRSINRFLAPADELKSLVETATGDEMSFVESRPMGSASLLPGFWDRLEIGSELGRFAMAGGVANPTEEGNCIFAMVANSALEALSKYATPHWLEGDVFVPDAPEGVYDEQLYRAMDFLVGVDTELQRAVFFSTADLLNLEAELLL